MNTPDTENGWKCGGCKQPLNIDNGLNEVYAHQCPTTPDTEWEREFDSRFNEVGCCDHDHHGDVCSEQSVASLKSFISNLLTKEREERDTYWKERVRKEVEGMDIVSTSYECGVGYRQAKHDILQALDNLK